MIAERIPREVVEAASREAYLEKYRSRGPTPTPANVEPTLQLLGAGGVLCVPYRGVGYALGFVSFEDGVKLLRAKAQVEVLVDDDLSDEKLAVYLEGMRVVVSMAPKYLRPVSLWRRFVYRALRVNPFRRATDREVGQLLGFFLTSRMRSRGLQAPGTPEAKLPDPTS